MQFRACDRRVDRRDVAADSRSSDRNRHQARMWRRGMCDAAHREGF